MDKDYYKEYYTNEREHWWFKVRENIINDRLKKITPNRNLTILNIGAATGRSTEFLSKYGTVTSIEYDKDCCEFLNKILNINAINASITELPFEDCKFDLVCAFDVIEHVDDDQKAMNEMLRVLKKGGFVVLTVPAFMSLWSSHDDINHHKRRYRKDELKKLTQNDKISNMYISYFNFLLFTPILLFRLFSNLIISKKTIPKSDFKQLNNKFLNSILFKIFSLELYLLRKTKLPFGVSIIHSFSKN